MILIFLRACSVAAALTRVIVASAAVWTLLAAVVVAVARSLTVAADAVPITVLITVPIAIAIAAAWRQWLEVGVARRTAIVESTSAAEAASGTRARWSAVWWTVLIAETTATTVSTATTEASAATATKSSTLEGACARKATRTRRRTEAHSGRNLGIVTTSQATTEAAWAPLVHGPASLGIDDHLAAANHAPVIGRVCSY